jgi:single-stranded-DNA-specific exonuclease
VLHSKARWTVSACDEEQAQRLAHQLGIDVLLARLLASRGWSDPEAASALLDGKLEDLHDPYLMDGMRAAVDRIRRAIRTGEKIRIYGDYDADGVCSTSLMIRLFQSLGADFDYYIPHRANEGYGLNRFAIDKARAAGIRLIVTVDNGISAVEEIEYARRLGIDVVVTDHHEPPDVLPDALVLINPKKPGCPYPFKSLAGVGVAFKLAHALLERIPDELLDLAAIGTIADVMPLLGENRLIVRYGLERIRSEASAGIRALLKVAAIDIATLNSGQIAFGLAPRINASGRLADASLAVSLLTANDPAEAAALAERLDRLNQERQRIVDEMTKEASAMAEAPERRHRDCLVLAKEGWNVGVIGIVASKILENECKPAVILSIDPETGFCKGSARSIPGFDIHAALTRCDDLLDHYGGHQAAAGMTMHRDNLAELEERLDRLAKERLAPDDFQPVLHADLACRLDQITVDAIERLDRLAPFGAENPPPRMLIHGVQASAVRRIGKDQRHLKITLRPSAGGLDRSVDAVAFGWGGVADLISPSARVELMGELSVNEWNGMRSPQIIVHDLRIPHVQVFDCRGAGGILKAARLFAQLQEELRLPASEIALLTAPSKQTDGILDHPDGLSHCSIWTYDETAGTAAVNEAAHDASFAEVRDLFILALPERLDSLQSALSKAKRLERIYAIYHADPAEFRRLPDRERFKAVYGWLMRTRRWPAGQANFAEAIAAHSGLSPETVKLILTVFEEVGLIQRNGSWYELAAVRGKRELESSDTYRKWMERDEINRVLVRSSTDQLVRWMLAQLYGGSSASRDSIDAAAGA